MNDVTIDQHKTIIYRRNEHEQKPKKQKNPQKKKKNQKKKKKKKKKDTKVHMSNSTGTDLRISKFLLAFCFL